VTVNELTRFPVIGEWYDVEAPSTSGSSNQVQFLVVSAFVEFTPRLKPGDVEYITNLDLGVTIAPPAGLAVTASGTGGTLAAGGHFWVVTAIDANGETSKSTEVNATTTGSTSSAVLTWSAVNGATGYKVYRGTSTTNENILVATLGNVLTYTDTGSSGTSASPPATNTAELSGNTALAIAPVQARIYEGQLQTIDQADTPNIQLLANSTILGLAPDGLIYDVAFTNVVYAGNAQVLSNFAFTAPTTSTTIDLGDPNLVRLEYNPAGYTQ
jgi:hypothetical protein